MNNKNKCTKKCNSKTFNESINSFIGFTGLGKELLADDIVLTAGTIDELKGFLDPLLFGVMKYNTCDTCSKAEVCKYLEEYMSIVDTIDQSSGPFKSECMEYSEEM